MMQKIVKLGVQDKEVSKPISVSFNPSSENATQDREKQIEAMQKRVDAQGSFAWSKLHAYKGCDPQWLEIWEYLIPRYGCSCSNDYALYKASTPPDFSSPEALWLWGFDLHNWVNRKLGKPELTVEEARLQWRSRDGEEITSEGMGGTALQQVPRYSESDIG